MAPFGLGRQKPHHYREMARVAWENRDQLPFAWRILTRRRVRRLRARHVGPVATGRSPGTHLCMVRLELLRLNTAPALDPALLADAARARAARSSAELRALGRLPEPMRRRAASAASARRRGTRRSTIVGAALARRSTRAASPSTSRRRGITNEVYYAAQKAARFLGTNHVDNSARLCHAASTVGDEGHARLRRGDLQLRATGSTPT